ncbi:hypothetical protein LXA47_28805 [Massilia sp. P8910]|uniref:hypothetical protein n=1 Tax=Massilia antarctica TaxID=2765360 RepID=UPI001E5896AE|nr:hypothetical protein [Massilia antarctica]MCE3607574.1 hypothetical protein [Massilia antarctica]
MTVRFGGVTIVAPKPEDKAVKKQIAAGKRVVTQLKKVLVTPGVKFQNGGDAGLSRRPAGATPRWSFACKTVRPRAGVLSTANLSRSRQSEQIGLASPLGPEAFAN